MMAKKHGEQTIVKNMAVINLHMRRIEAEYLTSHNPVITLMERVVTGSLK
jgi:hypothetical protein